jgi:hypothetical protein
MLARFGALDGSIARLAAKRLVDRLINGLTWHAVPM